MSDALDDVKTLVNKLLVEIAVTEANMENKVSEVEHIKGLGRLEKSLTKEINEIKMKALIYGCLAGGGGGGIMMKLFGG